MMISTFPKLVPVEELQSLGILQEVNRLFFHPLGMALGFEVDTQDLAVLDNRHAPEGMLFDAIDMEKHAAFCEFAEPRALTREAALGFLHQPYPGEAPKESK